MALGLACRKQKNVMNAVAFISLKVVLSKKQVSNTEVSRGSYEHVFSMTGSLNRNVVCDQTSESQFRLSMQRWH